MKRLLAKIFFCLFVLSISKAVYSQAMCPIEFLKVNRINGKVEFNDEKSEPFQNVKIVLINDDDNQTIAAETITDEKGLFEFKNIKKGKYILDTKFEMNGSPFFDYRAAIKVKETNSSKNKPSILIRFDIDCFKTEILTIK